ncbi:transketolase [Lachnospiraceae bacterium]|nr:transketolase [Lachnospiraceae bacterium]
MKSRNELELMAKDMRRDAYKMAYNSGTKGAHLGGGMSVVEILAVLYGAIMKYDVSNPSWEERDRLIMSKGHGGISLYAALKNVGYLSQEEIDGALHGDSDYYEHPRKNIDKGIEFSGGSLGQGLSFAAGMALGLSKRSNDKSRVYVILGDGECDEGSVWEAAASVIHFGLKQITVIIDLNGLQYDGSTEHIMRLGNMRSRWESIGYDVFEVDGHDVLALQDVFRKESEKPQVVIAHTVKGKGMSFAENRVEWHTAYLTEELYRQALKELEIC